MYETIRVTFRPHETTSRILYNEPDVTESTLLLWQRVQSLHGKLNV